MACIASNGRIGVASCALGIVHYACHLPARLEDLHGDFLAARGPGEHDAAG